jgi:hypothetical protein
MTQVERNLDAHIVFVGKAARAEFCRSVICNKLQ